jgi:hypothetical protein
MVLPLIKHWTVYDFFHPSLFWQQTELFLMSSKTGRQLPVFLSTPYDDCASFQSQSTELVVFSPSAGEYVTIAWYLNFLGAITCQVTFLFTMLGQHTVAVALWPTELRSGFAIVDSIGHAFAA